MFLSQQEYHNVEFDKSISDQFLDVKWFCY